MSLVLAFGLSPLGQAPAYAQGPDTQAAVSVLQAQDELPGVGTVYYTSSEQKYAEQDSPHLTYNDKFRWVQIHVDNAKDGTELKNVVAGGDTPSDSYTPGAARYTVKMTDDATGKDIAAVSMVDATKDLTFNGTGTEGAKTVADYLQAYTDYLNDDQTPDSAKKPALLVDKGDGGTNLYYAFVKDTGTYTLSATGTTNTDANGTGYRSGGTKTVQINVDKFDLSDADFVPIINKNPLYDSGTEDNPEWWTPYTASKQVIDAVVSDADRDLEWLADEISTTKASAGDTVGPYTLVVTPYGDDANKKVTGKAEVSFRVVKTNFLTFPSVGVYGEEGYEPGWDEQVVTNNTALENLALPDETTAATYATVNGEPVKGIYADADEDGNIVWYGSIGSVELDGDDKTVATDAAQVTVDKASNPLEIKFNNYELKDYSVVYHPLNEKGNGFDQATNISAAKLPSEVGSIYEAVIDFDTAAFTPSQYELRVVLEVSSAKTIEELADSALISEATYLGGAPLVPTVKDGYSATFTKGGQPVSSIGKAWSIVKDTFGIATGASSTTAALDNDNAPGAAPVAAGTYSVKVTGDDESFDATKTGIDATFKVNPRVAKEGDGVGDLKIRMNDQPFNDGNLLKMKAGEKGNFDVQMVTGTEEEDVVSIAETYDSFLGNTVRNWKVTWKDSKGKKVIAPSAVGDYTATFEFSGNLEGTPTIVKDFKVDAGDITEYADGLSTKAGEKRIYNPEATFLGKGVQSPDLVLVQRDKNGYYQEVDLENCKYDLTYAPHDDTASLDEEGNPLTVGTYDMTATFSGSYKGTLTGTFIVRELDLTNVVAANKTVDKPLTALVQFLQEDGSYDSVYSTVATGQAIEPEVQIVAVDEKGKPVKGAVVDPSVYEVSFSDNTAAGSKASIKVTPKGDQGANVYYTSVAQKNAFVIAQKSFSQAGAKFVLSENSLPLDSDKTFTLQLAISGNDALPYNTTIGRATIGDSEDPSTCILIDGKWYEGADVDSIDSEKPLYSYNYDDEWKVFDDKDTADAAYEEDADKYETAKSDYADKVAEYEDWSAAYKQLGKYRDAYDELDDDTEKESYTTENPVKAWLDSVSDLGISASDITNPDESKIEEPVAPEEFTLVAPTEVALAAAGKGVTKLDTPGNMYSLRVLDKKNNDVTSGISFDVMDPSQPTVVTVSNFPTSKAGDYTIVADAAKVDNPVYGGRVTAKFTVEGIDIADPNLVNVTYLGQKWNDNALNARTGKRGAYQLVALPYGADWSVPYNANDAKSEDGIELGAAAFDEDEAIAGGIVLTPAGDKAAWDKAPEKEPIKFTAEYESNHAAGTAKVTIKPEGDRYTGSIEKEFTIDRVELDEDTVEVIYDDAVVEQNYDKYGDNAFHTPYTGSAIEPSYEVVLFDGWNDDGTKNYTSYLDPEEYTAKWWKNTDVSYEPNSPKLAADAGVILDFTKNYRGSLDTSTFQIDPVDLSTAANVTIEDIADMPESAEKVIPNVVVKLNGNQLVQGKDFVVNTENDGKAGTYTAYVASANQGNVTVSTPIAKTFTIKKAEEITYDLTGATVELSAASFTYNGAIQAPTVSKVTLKNGVVLTADQFKATVPADSTNAGSYTVKVEGAKANVTGSAEAAYAIAKAANPLKVAKATRTAKKVSKKKAVVKGLNVKKAGQGTVTYKKVSVKKGKKAAAKKVAKKILVNKKTGKVTVKKGLAKGTYKVTVSAKAAGNANYEASKVLKAIVTLKVKK